MTTKTETIQAAPPRLIGSLRAGFDTVASHIGLIVFPVVLDFFIWFGPHFSLKSLLLPMIDSVMQLPGMNAPELADLMRTAHDVWLAIANEFNLASSLRTYPIGIPSLEASQFPQRTPFGGPLVLPIQSFWGVIGIWLVLSILGLLAGSLYFGAIARALAIRPYGKILGESTWAATQTIFLTLGWLALILVITMPAFFVVTILSLFSMALAQASVFVIGVLVVWLLVPLLFSPHGIFLFHQNAFTSMLTSVRVVRYLLPGTGMFFLAVVVLSQGLDILWQGPADTSWMSVVGIVGHAFITTGLIAASFVYYRDATLFVRELLNRSVASRQTPSKA
jgi:hypothetical protein